MTDVVLPALLCLLLGIVFLVLSGCSVPEGEGRRIGLEWNLDIDYNGFIGVERTGEGVDGLWDYYEPGADE